MKQCIWSGVWAAISWRDFPKNHASMQEPVQEENFAYIQVKRHPNNQDDAIRDIITSETDHMKLHLSCVWHQDDSRH